MVCFLFCFMWWFWLRVDKVYLVMDSFVFGFGFLILMGKGVIFCCVRLYGEYCRWRWWKLNFWWILGWCKLVGVFIVWFWVYFGRCWIFIIICVWLLWFYVIVLLSIFNGFKVSVVIMYLMILFELIVMVSGLRCIGCGWLRYYRRYVLRIYK